MFKSFLIDMDGVITRKNKLVPGAAAFIERLRRRNIKFLILTNNPLYTPGELAYRLRGLGMDLTSEHLYTSAMAVAAFLKAQNPAGTAFVLGERALNEALICNGYELSDQQADYVVVGDTMVYDYARITQGIRLIKNGACFIATNPEPCGLGDDGLFPTCGAIAALIEAATGVHPYFIGKPNPLVVWMALHRLNECPENAVLIGDRMDTDIRAGTESGMETILVLTGETTRDMVRHFAFKPSRIVESLDAIEMP